MGVHRYSEAWRESRGAAGPGRGRTPPGEVRGVLILLSPERPRRDNMLASPPPARGECAEGDPSAGHHGQVASEILEEGNVVDRRPRLEEISVKLVELRGFEPLTPRLPALCSPN